MPHTITTLTSTSHHIHTISNQLHITSTLYQINIATHLLFPIFSYVYLYMRRYISIEIKQSQVHIRIFVEMVDVTTVVLESLDRWRVGGPFYVT